MDDTEIMELKKQIAELKAANAAMAADIYDLKTFLLQITPQLIKLNVSVK